MGAERVLPQTSHGRIFLHIPQVNARSGPLIPPFLLPFLFPLPLALNSHPPNPLPPLSSSPPLSSPTPYPTTQTIKHSLTIPPSSGPTNRSTRSPSPSSSSRHCRSVRSRPPKAIIWRSMRVSKGAAEVGGRRMSLMTSLEGRWGEEGEEERMAAMVWRRISRQALEGQLWKMKRKK